MELELEQQKIDFLRQTVTSSENVSTEASRAAAKVAASNEACAKSNEAVAKSSEAATKSNEVLAGAAVEAIKTIHWPVTVHLTSSLLMILKPLPFSF